MSRRQRMEEVRGAGPEALMAAIVLQAVLDLDPPLSVHNYPGMSAEARRWLFSDDCGELLDLLDIPHLAFLDALRDRRLRNGTGARGYWEDLSTGELWPTAS